MNNRGSGMAAIPKRKKERKRERKRERERERGGGER